MSDDKDKERGTMTTLVEDLLRKPRTAARDALVKRALAGHYHDYRSTASLPKVALVTDLERCGYRGLALRARMGEYDDRCEPEDEARLTKEIGADPGLQRFWGELQGCTTMEEAIAVLCRHVSPEEARAALVELGWSP